MIDPHLRRAWRFFFRNAGWREPPGKAACALALARAERFAAEDGLYCEWKPDEGSEWDGEFETPEEIWGCVCYGPNGDVLASLGGIGDPSFAYRRVVEAELYQEALEALLEDEANAVPQI